MGLISACGGLGYQKLNKNYDNYGSNKKNFYGGGGGGGRIKFFFTYNITEIMIFGFERYLTEVKVDVSPGYD